MFRIIAPFFLLTFLLLFIGKIDAQLTANQYILSTSGEQGSFTNNQSLSWTIGEVIIETGNQNNYYEI